MVPQMGGLGSKFGAHCFFMSSHEVVMTIIGKMDFGEVIIVSSTGNKANSSKLVSCVRTVSRVSNANRRTSY